ncbi:MAG: sialidase family protein [Pirellulales bacterium]
MRKTRSRARRPHDLRRQPGHARLMTEFLEERVVLSMSAALSLSPDKTSPDGMLELINPLSNVNTVATIDPGTLDEGNVSSNPAAAPGDEPDILTNNNVGNAGTGFFTQSETTILAFGNTVVVGYNDSGSNAVASNKFTGFSRSIDGGLTFTDGGELPTNSLGDAGDPVLARNDTTGRLFFSTLEFGGSGIRIFRSDTGGASWLAPVEGAPGAGSSDKQWIAVDNFAGPGNGNVYHIVRDFGAANSMIFYRSTDNGNTFGPNGGTLIASGSGGNVQGAYVAVAPNHDVYTFFFDQRSSPQTIKMRKSIDFGVTFGPEVTVASLATVGTNGDMGLTGVRQGTGSPSGFRSNAFPHAAVNPVNGHVYVSFNDNPAGVDKGDAFMVMSTNGGATWSPRVRVNDDATTTDQWFPTITVSPGGDKLGIFYYSRQEDAVSNNLFKYYGRVGSISGPTVTFEPSFAVSNVASLPEFGRDTRINPVYMGDYNHAAATPGAFHVVWSDNRSDLPGGAPRKDPNVYYKKIELGLTVTTTVPAVGSVVSTVPVDYVANFSDDIKTTTVDASDFTVTNNVGTPVAANSFIINGPSQVTFHFNAAPFSNDGLHTMAMAAGSILRDGDLIPLLEFSGGFRYDTLLLQVVSTDPPFPDGIFTLPGPFTYDVNFNEPVDPASVATTDLTLSGIPGATVSGVTVLPGDTTARFTLDGLTIIEGELTASIAAGAITDVFGNPGAAFSATYQVDIGAVPYPTPLAAKKPAGSLIYDPTAAGTINFAGDVDSFILAVDPGQTITVLVTPQSSDLQPSVELRDPFNSLLGSDSAGAAGELALLQTLATTAGGNYTITLRGENNSTGGYQVQVVLNAALEEEETMIGASNNTLATAQDINASFVDLQTPLANAERGAVLSSIAESTGFHVSTPTFEFEDISTTGTILTTLTGQDDESASIPIGFTFPFYGVNNTTVFVSTNGLLQFGGANTSNLNTDLTTTPTQAAIAPFWDDLAIFGGVNSTVRRQVLGSGSTQHLVVQWNNASYRTDMPFAGGLTFQVVLGINGSIRFNYLDLATGNNGGSQDEGASATVGVKAAGAQGARRRLLAFNDGPNGFVGSGQSTLLTPVVGFPDYYAFSLEAGQKTTIALTGQSAGSLSLQLRSSSDAFLSGGIAADNLTRVINNFTAATTDTYYVLVAGSATIPYSLVVTRDADFDTEANDTFADAQNISGTEGALGAVHTDSFTEYVASAVPFAFENISATGTNVGLDGFDDGSLSIPVGFTFPFYGVNNTTLFVTSNGMLNFGGGDASFTNGNLTSSPSLATIAALWDDLFITGAADSKVVYQVLGSGASQRLVVQWNNISYFVDSPRTAGMTFQAVLGVDGSIRFNYPDLTTGRNGNTSDEGKSATVGIKAAGTQGPNRLLLAFNNAPNTFVGSGKSTLIALLPTEDWYSVDVPSAGMQLRFETRTPADGPGQFQNVLDPHIELFNPAGAMIASGVTIVAGRNEYIQLLSAPVAGLYRVRVTSDANAGEYFLGATVGNHEPILTNDLPSQSTQYSDAIAPVSVTATDTAGDTIASTSFSYTKDGGPSQPGLPASLSTSGPTVVTEDGLDKHTWTLSGLMDVGPGTYVITFAATDVGGATGSTDLTIVVTAEDAHADYTGPSLISTPTSNNGTVPVPLRAVIHDITALQPLSDPHPGVISNATVKFEIYDAANALVGTVDNVPVTLVNPADTKTGAAAATWVANLGNANSEAYRVVTIVNTGGYYKNDNQTDGENIGHVLITRPQRGYATAYGSQVTGVDSAGTYAGDPGSTINVSMTAKFNFTGATIGGLGIIKFRHGGRQYEIKADSFTSAAADPNTRHAEVIAVARLSDVTQPFQPVLIAANLTLNLALTDSPDTLGITLWNAGQLLYSSSWNGLETNERPFSGTLLVYAIPLAGGMGARAGTEAGAAVAPSSLPASAAASPAAGDASQLQRNTSGSFGVQTLAARATAAVLAQDDPVVEPAALDNELLNLLSLDRRILAARRK